MDTLLSIIISLSFGGAAILRRKRDGKDDDGDLGFGI